MRYLDSITDSVDMNLRKLWERVDNREAWHAATHGVSKSNNNLVSALRHQQKPGGWGWQDSRIEIIKALLTQARRLMLTSVGLCIPSTSQCNR